MYIHSILETKGPDLIAVSPGDSVRKVAKLFKAKRIGFALVHSGNHVTVGSVSERDIVQAIAEFGDVIGLPVADVMTTNVVTCNIDDTTDAVRDLMTTKRTRHVVVMDGAQAVGLVSIGDLIKHSLSECQVDTGMMRAYISGQGYQ
ncbi:MAG TPA: CBS domain-containing protein [Magnetovibrio sp.]